MLNREEKWKSFWEAHFHSHETSRFKNFHILLETVCKIWIEQEKLSHLNYSDFSFLDGGLLFFFQELL